MKLTLVVSADGQQRDVVAGPADFIAFERHFNLNAGVINPPSFQNPEKPTRAELRTMEAWGQRTRLEWWFFLAWSALHRAGEAPEFDEWTPTVDGVDLPQAEAIPPTETGDPSTDG